MANRINLNQTSFHGAGAIKEIAAEVDNKNVKDGKLSEKLK